MSALTWAGYWQDGTEYAEGDVVTLDGWAYLAVADTTDVPNRNSFLRGYTVVGRPDHWRVIGEHDPHPIDHPWMPEEAQYPLVAGLSDVAWLCRECWFSRNISAAFKAEAHDYVIQEMP